MRGLNQDLSPSERSLRSLERSRHRRAVAPQARRKAAARKRRAGVMAAAMLGGSGGALATASLSGSPSSRPAPASESVASLERGHHGGATLGLGSSGPAVTKVERRLDDLGYTVKVDRYFDRGTDRAVRRFQVAEGLRADGIVGPATWHALFARGAPIETGSPARDAGGQSGGEEVAGTRFAVRMARPDELSPAERERLGIGGPSLRSESEADAGELVAIQFEDRLPDQPPHDAPEPSTYAPERGAAPKPPAPVGDAGDGGSSSEAPSEAGAESPPPRRSEDRAFTLPSRPAGRAEPEPEPAPRVTAPPARSGTTCGTERMIAPVAGAVLTSSYRSAHRPSHAGIDLAAPSGTPIRSVACGVVSFLAGTAQTGGYGNYICVKHSTRLTTCYAHLSRFSDERVGDQVRRGDVIGYVGNTGHSTGPHLHFEVRSANPYGRNDVDPMPYLAGRAIPGTRVGPSAIGGPDLASTPHQQPSTSPTPPTPGASGAPGALAAPAGDSPTSALSDRAPERMDEVSAAAPTENTSAAAASDRPSSERRAMGSPPELADTESSDDPSPDGGRDLHETEASSKPSEAAPGQSTALAATDGRGGLDAPEGETQEPTEETTEDGASAETPSSDDEEGLEARGGGAASGSAEEGDASAPVPEARVPFSGLQATPFGGVDALLPPGLTPGVDSDLATLPSPVTPG